MQAPAQLQATIELLDEIDQFRYPADRTMAAYFKQRRYIGSKDKAVISEYFYTILRNKLSFSYLLEEVGLTANSRRLAALLLRSLNRPVSDFFTGEGHAPVSLSISDAESIESIDMASLSNAPINVRLNVPSWISAKLQMTLKESFEAEMMATNQQATTDIRVNTLKSSRKQVSHFLKKNNLDAENTTLSPWGMRFNRRVALFGTEAFKQGWFDIQDEGSQLLALISGVSAGQKVVDFCAGAGGKTLALAAMMANKGTIYACDVHSKRLEQLTLRAKRAGVHNIRTHILSSEHDKWVKKHKGLADVVLLDAPCSGTGTWRRSPDSRWNLSEEDLSNLVSLQASILESAKRLVKPGGTFLYATCSLLAEENEEQIDRFLTDNSEFQGKSGHFADFLSWQGKVAIDDYQLRTYPALTGTDGFYVAALSRIPEENC